MSREIRPGGQVRLPRVELTEEGYVYPEGLTEGNLLAIKQAAEKLSNAELRRRFGPEIAQALIDRGYGREQRPSAFGLCVQLRHERACPGAPCPVLAGDGVLESYRDGCAAVKAAILARALRLGLLRDRFGRPLDL